MSESWSSWSGSGVFLESSVCGRAWLACVLCVWFRLTCAFVFVLAGIRSAYGWAARYVNACCVCRVLSSSSALRGVALGGVVGGGQVHSLRVVYSSRVLNTLSCSGWLLVATAPCVSCFRLPCFIISCGVFIGQVSYRVLISTLFGVIFRVILFLWYSRSLFGLSWGGVLSLLSRLCVRLSRACHSSFLGVLSCFA